MLINHSTIVLILIEVKDSFITVDCFTKQSFGDAHPFSTGTNTIMSEDTSREVGNCVGLEQQKSQRCI